MSKSVSNAAPLAWALGLALVSGSLALGQAERPIPTDADLAADIEKEVGQPPQMVLDYVRQHPYTRQALLDAAARTGVDVNTLSAIFFAEFDVSLFRFGRFVDVIEDGEYVTREVTENWTLLDGAQAGIDSYNMVGIDAFAEEAPQLKRRGLLPPDFAYRFEDYRTENERGMPVKPVVFANLRDAIAALAAVARGRQDRALAKLAEMGVAQPSFEERAAATYLFYNAAHPGLWLGKARASKGGLAKLGRLAPSWRVRLRNSSAFQNAGRVLATALLFKRAGVFAPVDAPVQSQAPPIEGPEAAGAIKKLAAVAQ